MDEVKKGIDISIDAGGEANFTLSTRGELSVLDVLNCATMVIMNATIVALDAARVASPDVTLDQIMEMIGEDVRKYIASDPEIARQLKAKHAQAQVAPQEGAAIAP